MRANRLRLAMGFAIVAINLSAFAAEPVVVVDSLSQPTSLAIREGQRGGVELAIAEAGAGCVTSVTLLGEERQAAVTLVEGLGADPRAVAWAMDEVLFVAGEKLTAYSCSQPGLPATELSSAAAVPTDREAFSSPVTSERYLFAIRDHGLWRSRRLADQLTEVRAVGFEDSDNSDHAVIGAALNNRGYLTLLVEARVSHELWFVDPERPEVAGTVTPVTGLEAPIAMAYGAVSRPSEPLLYALQADGVYRIDASGPSLATAKRVVAGVEGAKAMAFGPDGALYIVTAEDSRTGVVLRFSGEF